MRLALLGDLAFFGKNSVENNPNVFKYFEKVAGILKDFDYVIGNLETPFVTNQKPNGSKSAFIKSHPKNVELLKYLNVDIVNLANNHIFDFGIESHQLTKDILDKNDIQYFGTENKELFIEKGNVKIALNGYCCLSSNPLGLKMGLNILDVKEVESKLSENHKNGFFNVIAMHCGQEHVHTPNYDHLQMARQLAEIAPYVFYGHHPHVIQGIETKNEALLAYSLGNFCFDDIYKDKSKEEPFVVMSEANKKSFILTIELNENGVAAYDIIPVCMGSEELEFGSKEISQEIEVFSKKLTIEKSTYIKERQGKREAYINSRKEMRDLKWYLSRLNFGSVSLLLTSRKNKKMYAKYVKQHLK